MSEHELTEQACQRLKESGFDKMATQFRAAAGGALASARALVARRPASIDPACEPIHVYRPADAEPRR